MPGLWLLAMFFKYEKVLNLCSAHQEVTVYWEQRTHSAEIIVQFDKVALPQDYNFLVCHIIPLAPKTHFPRRRLTFGKEIILHCI